MTPGYNNEHKHGVSNNGNTGRCVRCTIMVTCPSYNEFKARSRMYPKDQSEIRSKVLIRETQFEA